MFVLKLARFLKGYKKQVILGPVFKLIEAIFELIVPLVIEKIFSIPGLGSLYIQAIQSNDYNVVLAISFIYSVIFIVAMLLVDLLYGVIDPRIRVAAKGEA